MIPRAFRIRDFRSIIDTGACPLSGDNITVLAGQNEAGKTAVLSALRDFDLPENDKPRTPEYMPEGRYDASPYVSVEFEIDVDHIVESLEEDNHYVPERLVKHLRENPRFWIHRDLVNGRFFLDEQLLEFWGEDSSDGRSATEQPDSSVGEEATREESLEPHALATELRSYWPQFIYFDSFTDILPREVEVDGLIKKEKGEDKKAEEQAATPIVAPKASDIAEMVAQLTSGKALNLPAAKAAIPPAPKPAPLPPKKTIQKQIPQSVRDFITLSDLDLKLLSDYSTQDKMLGNYLQSRSAHITGDFLTYWKQRLDKDQTIDLHIRHLRDESGTLKLAFFVRDKVDQFPEQRSKGFLWFLSFYLRLAAEEKRGTRLRRLLLVDEPGSYLHARAQRDVLHLFEDRIAPKQQIIYSTHSPFLLPADKLHRLRVVLKKRDKGTLILDRLTHPELQGDEFTDTLSPIISAIGLDLRGFLSFTKENNLLVEGISDHLYLTAWAREFLPDLLDEVNVFPGTGASTVPLFASLFIGWGLPFAALLDRDPPGTTAKEKLTDELLVPDDLIIQPHNALAIEDMLSAKDFQSLLTSMDKSLKLNTGETPSKAIKRMKLDKILLARTYAEQASSNPPQLTAESQTRINALLNSLLKAARQAKSNAGN